MKTALIVGSQGQDGQLLWNHLSSMDYGLIGLGFDFVRCQGVDWHKKIDIHKNHEVVNLIELTQPDEVYYLAAKHRSSQDAASEDLAYYKETFDLNVYALAHFLEAMKLTGSRSRLFYASSSHVFGRISGEALDTPQVETTPYHPESIYGISKVAATHLCRLYRKKFGVFASVGILYNHESALRKESFISKKIVCSALRIKKGLQQKLVVGDLSAQIDWGYAPDYVEAMNQILQLSEPDEFIIASGRTHSVQEFVEAVFSKLDLDWRFFVEEDRKILTCQELTRVGNFSKLNQATGWTPRTSFEAMVNRLVKEVGLTIL